MKRTRGILLLALGALFLAAAFIFWARPANADMAAYAPADSLLYIETNDPLAVIHSVGSTDAAKMIGISNPTGWGAPGGWLRSAMKTTGIGPVESVILSRAQIAIVVTNLGTTEEGETLRVKPEFALIVETHTLEYRIRSWVEQSLSRLAESTYNKPSFRRTQVNGVEFIEWRNHEGSRQIVAAIVGSLVVVANSEASVQRCLDTAAGRAPSLWNDTNLHRLRREVSGNQSLTFGYVPETRSAQLLAFVVPLILGRAPGDAGFQQLLSKASAKLFGSIAWGSKSFQKGIEDRYLIALQPSFLGQLQSSLRSNSGSTYRAPVPNNSYSATYYNLQDPLAAWEGLRTTVSANTDAVSAVVFGSLMKSALVSYGVSEPEPFLQSVTGNILTVRLDPNGDQTLLIAEMKNRETLRTLVTKTMTLDQDQKSKGSELFIDKQGEMAAAMVGNVIVMGSLPAVRRYSETETLSDTSANQAQLRRMTALLPLEGSNPIITYTEDSDRVLRFFEAMKAAGSITTLDSSTVERSLSGLPYAATETRLVATGVERVTRSPLGQFSSFLPLLIPEKSGTVAPTAPAR